MSFFFSSGHVPLQWIQQRLPLPPVFIAMSSDILALARGMHTPEKFLIPLGLKKFLFPSRLPFWHSYLSFEFIVGELTPLYFIL
jgi:hypothetical protein